MRKKIFFYGLMVVFSLAGGGFYLSSNSKADCRTQGRERISMMTFNVENLFDTKRNIDPTKDDSTYLPIALKNTKKHIEHCSRQSVAKWRRECLRLDWSEETLEKKLALIAEAILQVDNGRGPDIVFLQEVENRYVLERLSKMFLSAAGYKEIVLRPGRDARGINVAVLTRLPLASAPVLHLDPDFETVTGERGILETTLILPDGENLTTYVLHLPSQFNPPETRERVLTRLRDLQKAHPPEAMVIAAGDFNISKREEGNLKLLKRLVEPHWLVAHRLGCTDCKGTYYYGRQDEWSFFDMILAAPSLAPNARLATPWKILPCSVRIANSAVEQSGPDDTPKAFNPNDGSGTSDHWPLVVEIEAVQSRMAN